MKEYLALYSVVLVCLVVPISVIPALGSDSEEERDALFLIYLRRQLIASLFWQVSEGMEQVR